MFKNKCWYYLCLGLISVSSCQTEFEKLRTGNNNNKYQEAIKYYHARDYSRAFQLFEDLAPRYRGRPEAEDLFYYYAYANYHLRNYAAARYHFKNFTETYPLSPKAEEARFMSGYCYYLDAPVYSLDQDNTVKAIEALQLFINLYPTSTRVSKATQLIQELRGKLERKSYENAKLYLNIGDFKSASIAFKNALEEFPDTKYAEEMEFLSLKAQYLYAKNSRSERQKDRFLAVVSACQEFSEKYPNSPYLEQAQELKYNSEKTLAHLKLAMR